MLMGIGMAFKRTLVDDERRGVEVTMEEDPEDGGIIIKQYANMDHVLDHNAELRSISDQPLAGNTQRHMQHVASIPLPIYFLWKTTLGDPHTDPAAEKRWRDRLNSNEFQKMRTGGGHI
ncbi:MAG: hypothetical protein ACR2PS_05990 [Pseudomonadales bacterium]